MVAIRQCVYVLFVVVLGGCSLFKEVPQYRSFDWAVPVLTAQAHIHIIPADIQLEQASANGQIQRNYNAEYAFEERLLNNLEWQLKNLGYTPKRISRKFIRGKKISRQVNQLRNEYQYQLANYNRNLTEPLNLGSKLINLTPHLGRMVMLVKYRSLTPATPAEPAIARLDIGVVDTQTGNLVWYQYTDQDDQEKSHFTAFIAKVLEAFPKR